ncbi:MAG TPA: MarC family protein [Bdellovibrionota bacterium]|nr:MarC family protein [Bdellovibrionota bacterium]
MSGEVLHQFALAFIALFVALDVIGILPMFTALTHGQAGRVRKVTVDRSMGVAFALAMFFMFLGEAVFRYLGITLPDFKIAGGIVLLLISLADLLGSPEASKRASGNSGIVPLAVPLITGPAVLATLVIQAKTYGYPITLASLLANYLLAWLILGRAHRITGLIGKDGTVVVSKIAALLLAAISVAMIRSGIVETIRVTQ